MIRIKHRARVGKVKVVLGFLRPREVEHAFDIIAHLRLLVRTSGQFPEPVDFFLDGLAQRIRHGLLFKALKEHVRIGLLRFTEFRADGLDLLAQVVFFLVLVHPALYFLRNAAVYAQNFNFIQHKRKRFTQAFRNVKAFEHMLPLLRLHKRYVGNRVRKRAHIFRARNVLRSVRRKLGGKCGIFAKRFCQAAAQRLRLGFVIRRCNERHGVHSQVFPVFKAGKTRAANPVHKHAHCIAREIQHLTDAAQRADAVNVVPSDLVFPYILLRCKEHNAAAASAFTLPCLPASKCSSSPGSTTRPRSGTSGICS